MRLIGLLIIAALLAIALWLVFINPRLGGGHTSPPNAAITAAPAIDDLAIRKKAAEEAALKEAAAKAKAAKAKAAKAKAALAAERAVEAAQADALEQNMTPAQNRLTEDYAAQVGDTRPAAASAAADNSTSPDEMRR